MAVFGAVGMGIVVGWLTMQVCRPVFGASADFRWQAAVVALVAWASSMLLAWMYLGRLGLAANSVALVFGLWGWTTMRAFVQLR